MIQKSTFVSRLKCCFIFFGRSVVGYLSLYKQYVANNLILSDIIVCVYVFRSRQCHYVCAACVIYYAQASDNGILYYSDDMIFGWTFSDHDGSFPDDDDHCWWWWVQNYIFKCLVAATRYVLYVFRKCRYLPTTTNSAITFAVLFCLSYNRYLIITRRTLVAGNFIRIR